LKPRKQLSPFETPWSMQDHILLSMWRLTWLLLCAWTPKYINPWRLLILKIFGAKVSGSPFVHQSVQIRIPWHLTLHHRACLGERVQVYSLGEIEVHQNATIAQEAYLCTGTHDFNNPAFQLITKKITIGENTFIGARAMILPGISVHKNAVVGAQSVVSKDVAPNQIVAGNPAMEVGRRTIAK
jgi:putative colanic acid biosynthesis acetyltransferase WcaF